MKIYATTSRAAGNSVLIKNLSMAFPEHLAGKKGIDIYTLHINDRKSYREINNAIHALTGSERTYIDTFLL